jgi:hypothetical protein
MARFQPTPIAVFAVYSLGIEAVVGYVLGGSTGLSELHKTVLVGFIVGFPILSLLTFPLLAARETRRLADAELAELSDNLTFHRPQDLRAAE